MKDFAVIFDMDGTLLDTQRICIPAWEYAGRQQNISDMGSNIVDVCGMNELGWTGYLIKNYPQLDIDAFKRDVRGYITEHGKVEFKSGAKELLSFLKKNGVKTAIASGSSRASIDHHLQQVNAKDCFDAVAGGSDVENGKPAPDIFLCAAKRLGVNAEDCFVFEDSANGIKAGYAAGMKCIGVADIVPFGEDIKKLMFKELKSLDEAISIFEEFMAEV